MLVYMNQDCINKVNNLSAIPITTTKITIIYFIIKIIIAEFTVCS